MTNYTINSVRDMTIIVIHIITFQSLDKESVVNIFLLFRVSEYELKKFFIKANDFF